MQVNKLLYHGNTPYKVNINFRKIPISYTTINICMINKNGTGLLKRITYIPNNNDLLYNFYADDIKEIDSLLIAPESDNIDIKNIEIYVDDLLYKFNNNIIIGDGRNNVLAGVLKPENNDKAYMKLIYDAEYKDFKDSVIVLTLELSVIGSLITGYFTNIEKAYSFGLGGSIGLLYVLLLEMGIDNMGKERLGILTSGQVRLGIIGAFTIFLMNKYHDNIMNDHSNIIICLIGFMMYRLAIIGSYIKK